MNPQFSIIIPMFNAEDSIARCIDSVLSQTLDSYEVILVDDGSTDGAPSICVRYESLHPGIIRYVRQTNHGSYCARIKGLTVSHGEFVIFVDADDELRQDALEVISRKITSDIDIIFFEASWDTNFNTRNYGIHLYDSSRKVSQSDIIALMCTTRSLNPLWNKAIRRSRCLMTEYANLNSGLAYGEDLYQFMQVVDFIRNGMSITDCIYCYRYSKNSISNRYYPRRFKDISLVRSYLYEKACGWQKKYELSGLAIGVDVISLQEICEFSENLVMNADKSYVKPVLENTVSSTFAKRVMSNQTAIHMLRCDRMIEIFLLDHSVFSLFKIIVFLKKWLKNVWMSIRKY